MIYLESVDGVNINNNIFERNDALPIFHMLQEVGLRVYDDATTGTKHTQRTSTIYIGEYVHNLNIENNVFKNQTLDFLAELIKKENKDLFNYFPPYYF